MATKRSGTSSKNERAISEPCEPIKDVPHHEKLMGSIDRLRYAADRLLELEADITHDGSIKDEREQLLGDSEPLSSVLLYAPKDLDEISKELLDTINRIHSALYGD